MVLEARAQSHGSLQLMLYTSNVERMLLFYEILNFHVVEDHGYVWGRYLVMALRDNAGAQICLAEADSEQSRDRIGKQFFRITSEAPHIPHRILSARDFRVSDYSPYQTSEFFHAYDPEGNEVLVSEARSPRRSSI